MKVLFLLLALSLSLHALAKEEEDLYVDCKELKQAPAGSYCTTWPGHYDFMRVKINGKWGIKDLSPGGRIWFDAIYEGSMSLAKAKKKCRKSGQMLPSDVDFELAEFRGFREALNEDWTIKNEGGALIHIYWSSTVSKNGFGHLYHMITDDLMSRYIRLGIEFTPDVKDEDGTYDHVRAKCVSTTRNPI